MRIFLTGYMGSGKSTFGPRLARELGLSFYDLDAIIEAQTWMSIKEIFKKKGEEAFREMEAESLRQFALQKDNFVLSCGGGTPCYYQNMEWMKEQGFVIFLDVPIPELVSRLLPETGDRPLIKKMSPEQLTHFIEDHLDIRTPVYHQAHLILDASKPEWKRMVEEVNAAIKEA
jgi:shikimate kinase